MRAVGPSGRGSVLGGADCDRFSFTFYKRRCDPRTRRIHLSWRKTSAPEALEFPVCKSTYTRYPHALLVAVWFGVSPRPHPGSESAFPRASVNNRGLVPLLRLQYVQTSLSPRLSGASTHVVCVMCPG